MSVLKLYEYPHPVLSQKCTPVEKVDEQTVQLLKDMLETMYADHGVGLAAPQIGVSKRMIVIDVEQQGEDETFQKGRPMFLINPEIIYKSEETIFFCEGCLSVPEQRADVERAQKIKVRYLNEQGKQMEIEAEDYPAVVLQHEIDHLDGILYIDHLSKLKRQMLLKKLEKLRQQHKDAQK